MKGGVLIACAVLVSVSCASPPPPPMAGAPPDWPSVAGERVPSIVTRDPDGEERVTKLWLVVVDGQGLIRTGNSRWFGNIERDPEVVFRVGGQAFPLCAESITDAALVKRANAAFREKYGFGDWIIHPFGEPDKNVMRLVPCD